MRWTLVIGLAASVGGSPAASAQPKDEDKAEADRLFYEGRELLAKDQRVAACQKFDQSFRKDPRAVGTILNLGLCREISGETATAVRYYQEARDRAHDQGLTEYQQAAERKIALLAPRVPHVTITLTEPLPDMRIIVDNVVLAPDQLRDVTVDPGERTIVVTAPRRLPFETKITVAEGKPMVVAIPRLQGQTVIVRTSSRRQWGKIAVASGIGLVAGGIGLGFYARSRYWSEFPDGARSRAVMDPDHNCWTEVDTSGGIARRCNEVGQEHLVDARRLSHIATGLGITGGVAAAVGVVLWWTAPRDAPVEVGVALGEHGGSVVTLSGAF